MRKYIAPFALSAIALLTPPANARTFPLRLFPDFV